MTRILVVDDEFDLLEALRAILETEGFEVYVAGNGKQGLEEMRRAQPDVVLVDLMMPVMDGLELIRAVREEPRLQRTPMILMSAMSPKVDAKHGGYDAFLQKPFDLGRLLSVLSRLGAPGTRA